MLFTSPIFFRFCMTVTGNSNHWCVVSVIVPYQALAMRGIRGKCHPKFCAQKKFYTVYFKLQIECYKLFEKCFKNDSGSVFL